MPDLIDNNLRLFLSLARGGIDRDWCFANWGESRKRSMGRAAAADATAAAIYCFPKREICGFLVFLLYLRLAFRRNIRIVLYLNDGLLSSIFETGSTRVYQHFAANHLPPSINLKQRLLSKLPLLFRAERRYIVLEGKAPHYPVRTIADTDLHKLDFMFFSNADGKQLLISGEVLRAGKGWMIKTSSNPAFIPAMEKEYASMQAIPASDSHTALRPRIGKRFVIGGRLFFEEEYVYGKSLRDILHRISNQDSASGICSILNQLNDWFERYRQSFELEPKPLQSCYGHLFNAFSTLYGQDPHGRDILEYAKETLQAPSKNGIAIAPITAHNDLWPGNFLVSESGLIAIDWERSAENRAPLFDYYWMVVSATLEYLVCKIGRVDYSRAFRTFLAQSDDASCYAAVLLKAFMAKLALDCKMYPDFLFLFLMEWSVQGYTALGKQTAMDRLAFGELVHYMDAVEPCNPTWGREIGC